MAIYRRGQSWSQMRLFDQAVGNEEALAWGKVTSAPITGPVNLHPWSPVSKYKGPGPFPYDVVKMSGFIEEDEVIEAFGFGSKQHLDLLERAEGVYGAEARENYATRLLVNSTPGSPEEKEARALYDLFSKEKEVMLGEVPKETGIPGQMELPFDEEPKGRLRKRRLHRPSKSELRQAIIDEVGEAEANATAAGKSKAPVGSSGKRSSNPQTRAQTKATSKEVSSGRTVFGDLADASGARAGQGTTILNNAVKEAKEAADGRSIGDLLRSGAKWVSDAYKTVADDIKLHGIDALRARAQSALRLPVINGKLNAYDRNLLEASLKGVGGGIAQNKGYMGRLARVIDSVTDMDDLEEIARAANDAEAQRILKSGKDVEANLRTLIRSSIANMNADSLEEAATLGGRAAVVDVPKPIKVDVAAVNAGRREISNWLDNLTRNAPYISNEAKNRRLMAKVFHPNIGGMTAIQYLGRADNANRVFDFAETMTAEEIRRGFTTVDARTGEILPGIMNIFGTSEKELNEAVVGARPITHVGVVRTGDELLAKTFNKIVPFIEGNQVKFKEWTSIDLVRKTTKEELRGFTELRSKKAFYLDIETIYHHLRGRLSKDEYVEQLTADGRMANQLEDIYQEAAFNKIFDPERENALRGFENKISRASASGDWSRFAKLEKELADSDTIDDITELVLRPFDGNEAKLIKQVKGKQAGRFFSPKGTYYTAEGGRVVANFDDFIDTIETLSKEAGKHIVNTADGYGIQGFVVRGMNIRKFDLPLMQRVAWRIAQIEDARIQLRTVVDKNERVATTLIGRSKELKNSISEIDGRIRELVVGEGEISLTTSPTDEYKTLDRQKRALQKELYDVNSEIKAGPVTRSLSLQEEIREKAKLAKAQKGTVNQVKTIEELKELQRELDDVNGTLEFARRTDVAKSKRARDIAWAFSGQRNPETGEFTFVEHTLAWQRWASKAKGRGVPMASLLMASSTDDMTMLARIFFSHVPEAEQVSNDALENRIFAYIYGTDDWKKLADDKRLKIGLGVDDVEDFIGKAKQVFGKTDDGPINERLAGLARNAHQKGVEEAIVTGGRLSNSESEAKALLKMLQGSQDELNDALRGLSAEDAVKYNEILDMARESWAKEEVASLRLSTRGSRAKMERILFTRNRIFRKLLSSEEMPIYDERTSEIVTRKINELFLHGASADVAMNQLVDREIVETLSSSDDIYMTIRTIERNLETLEGGEELLKHFKHVGKLVVANRVTGKMLGVAGISISTDPDAILAPWEHATKTVMERVHARVIGYDQSATQELIRKFGDTLDDVTLRTAKSLDEIFPAESFIFDLAKRQKYAKGIFAAGTIIGTGALLSMAGTRYKREHQGDDVMKRTRTDSLQNLEARKRAAQYHLMGQLTLGTSEKRNYSHNMRSNKHDHLFGGR